MAARTPTSAPLGAPVPDPPGPGRAGTLARSFGYAFAGLFHVARTQRNFRIHLAAGVLAAGLAWLLHLSATEWAVLAVVITLVLGAEMMNTVVEALVDLASPAYHPLAKIAKDVAAGAVLLTAIGAVVTGLFLFLPHLLR